MFATRSPEASTEARPHEFSKEEVYNAVKNLRRRYVLYHLDREGHPVELGDLAEQVAAWENNTTIENVSREQRKSVYSALYQTHLPKLEDIGVVTYDRQRKEVSFTDAAKAFELHLATDDGVTVRWHRVYLGLSLFGTVVLAAAWFGLIPFSSPSGFQLATVLLGTFGVTAVAHVYDRYCWRQRFQGTTPDFALEFEERRWFQ